MPDLELLTLVIMVFRNETSLTDPYQLELFFLADLLSRSLPLFPNTLADFETLWGLDDLDFEDYIMMNGQDDSLAVSNTTTSSSKINTDEVGDVPC